MARLIPKIAVDEITLKPERDVAKALIEQLPADCIVYHSYPWLRQDRSDRNIVLREGETDFVIVLPDMGILILEVKGGPIEYDADNRLWYRCLNNGGKRPIKDPFDQARKNTHEVQKLIAQHSFSSNKHIPCAFGYAVIFPDCNYAGPMPPGAENSIILSCKDLPFLDRRMPEILRKWSRKPHPRPLSKIELDGVVEGLSPLFKLLPVLFRKIEEQEERLFRLTNEQIRLLDFLRNNNRVAIEGVAGSGKTILAMAQAQRFADHGLNTLMLCYNRALAEWLSGTLPDQYQGRVTIINFHKLCWQLCKETGIAFEGKKRHRKFWRDEAPYFLMEAIEKTEKRFDAIIVDEGQDFSPNWWTPIELLCRVENGPFYLFYDPAQNLFVGDDFTIPNLGKPLTLPTNCRNTKKIAETCSQIRGCELPVREDAPLGDAPTVIIAKTPEVQQKHCREIIKGWCGNGGMKPSQISIQAAKVRNKTWLDTVTDFQGIPITENIEAWENNEGILFSTIRSFKGLESDATIIIDIMKPDIVRYFTRADFYVACSRAKHLLVILVREENVI